MAFGKLVDLLVLAAVVYQQPAEDSAVTHFTTAARQGEKCC